MTNTISDGKWRVDSRSPAARNLTVRPPRIARHLLPGLVIGLAGLLLAAESSHAQAVSRSTADVFGQGPGGPVIAPDGASLMRTPKGLTIAVSIPTPLPGSYTYPPNPSPWQPAPVPGYPEVFSGWAFVFNRPDECSTVPCAPPTPTTSEGKVGVYNFAGHIVGGPTLTLVGHIDIGETVFGHPNPDANNPLDNPAGAEVHIAIAPHGMLLPDVMPDQINTPVGSPAYWWISVFIPK